MQGIYNKSGGKDIDDQLSGPRNLKHRMDEVARMTRWHRIAPPMGLGTLWPTLRTYVDPVKLTDSWTFRPGDTWDHGLIGKTTVQAGPARVSRGVALPTVTPARDDANPCGEAQRAVPFVVASKHANGAFAIGTLGRYNDTLGYCTPKASVRLDWPKDEAMTGAPPTRQLVGVFGKFGSLTLALPPLWKVSQVLAQDLLANAALDITSRVHLNGSVIDIDGSVLSELGTAARSSGDVSEPGLVLALKL